MNLGRVHVGWVVALLLSSLACSNDRPKRAEFVAEWGSPGVDPGQFNEPIGIAVDASGNVYVSDTGNNRIQKFNPDGVLLETWGTAGDKEGEFERPMHLHVDSSGKLFIPEYGNDRI